MTTYAVHAMVRTHDGGFHGARQVPLFYLDSDVQGIVSATHAVTVAAGIVNPLGLIAAADLDVTAYALPDDGGRHAGPPEGRHTHLARRESGTVAGWHKSLQDAQACADECNRQVTADPAHVELLAGDEAWDAILGNPDGPAANPPAWETCSDLAAAVDGQEA